MSGGKGSLVVLGMRWRARLGRSMRQGFNSGFRRIRSNWRKPLGEITRPNCNSGYRRMRGEDAVQRSLATILGRVGEELAPLIIFANYGIEPKDLRHIGSPVDYIAFKGYSSNKRVEEIIFFEIKTGKTAKLSDIEKSVRNVIASGKVRYVVINVKEGLEKLQASKTPEEKSGQDPAKADPNKS